MSCCLKIAIQLNAESSVVNFDLTTPTGTYNGVDYWEFVIDGVTYTIRMELEPITLNCRWELTMDFAGGQLLAYFTSAEFSQKSCVECPIGTWVLNPEAKIPIYLFIVTDCDVCTFLQERDKRKYNSIRLPEVFEEEDRGFFRCCCKETVLASESDADTWKNDVVSAWIKLSSITDSVTFELYKDGQLATFTPTVQSFVNESFAFYTTINWQSVLNTDGAGCYELKVNYNISGIIGNFVWGIYQLKPFSVQNALETARVRVLLDSYQEIEQIDFTGSQVETSLRFNGFIGLRQPNTEIDNIIYQDREVKSVIRENLNSYEIKTDPLCEQFTTQLTDLYLLSENELFISDYNAHNHSYKFNDLPVIVEESPELIYYDYARDAALTCKVGDKKKNKRTYYK
jgi:hypothetical protein